MFACCFLGCAVVADAVVVAVAVAVVVVVDVVVVVVCAFAWEGFSISCLQDGLRGCPEVRRDQCRNLFVCVRLHQYSASGLIAQLVRAYGQ